MVCLWYWKPCSFPVSSPMEKLLRFLEGDLWVKCVDRVRMLQMVSCICCPQCCPTPGSSRGLPKENGGQKLPLEKCNDATYCWLGNFWGIFEKEDIDKSGFYFYLWLHQVRRLIRSTSSTTNAKLVDKVQPMWASAFMLIKRNDCTLNWQHWSNEKLFASRLRVAFMVRYKKKTWGAQLRWSQHNTFL